MIVRVGGELRLEPGRVGCACGQRQPRAQRVGAVGRLRVVACEQLPGLVVAAKLHQYLDGVEANGFVPRLFTAGFRELDQGLVELAGSDQGCGFLAQVATGIGQGEAVEKGTDLAFRQCAGEFIHQLALEQYLDRGNAAHTEVLGKFGIFVGIHLGQQEAAGVFLGELFEHRLQCLARPAPRCPEVDDHRYLHGWLDDLGFEFLDGNVKGELGHGETPMNERTRIIDDANLRKCLLFGYHSAFPQPVFP